MWGGTQAAPYEYNYSIPISKTFCKMFDNRNKME